MTVERSVTIARILNMLALAALLLVLAGSLFLQFGLGEQPCPLCLIQRSGMIGLAIGPMLNLVRGLRPGHYAISILAACVGGAGSVRQILLHIATPGDPGFGPAVLGFHLYTWADIVFLIAVIGCALLLMWSTPFSAQDDGILGTRSTMRAIGIGFMAWVVLDLAIILIAVIPECGIGMCPDDPPEGLTLGAAGGAVLVLGVGVIAFAIGAVMNRRMANRD